MSRFALYGPAALAVLAVIAGGWWWINSIVSENRRLAADNASLTAAVETQKATITAMSAHMTTMAEDVKRANAAMFQPSRDAQRHPCRRCRDRGSASPT